MSKFFYRDKSRLYCFSPTSDGGYLDYMSGIDPDDLVFLYEDGWGPSTLSTPIETYRGDYVRKDLELISWYASDGISVFYRCTKIESADVESLRLETEEGAHWTARDRNRFYDGSHVVSE